MFFFSKKSSQCRLNDLQKISQKFGDATEKIPLFGMTEFLKEMLDSKTYHRVFI